VRKLWYAGATLASGVLLFAASPARADVQPAGAPGSSAPSDLLPGNSIAPPFGDLLSGAGGWALTHGNSAVSGARGMAMSGTGHALSGANDAAGQARNGLDRVRRPTNNLHLTVPLDGSRPLTRLRPGTNSPDLASGVLPAQRPAEGLPSADVIGPLEPDTALNGGGGLLGGDLLGQLPLLSGVMPNGQQQSFDSLDRPTAEPTESAGDGMPLLGGLGGALPVEGLPSVPGGDVPDLAGLPGGGMAVLAPAASSAADPTTDPATGPTVAPSLDPTSAPALDPNPATAPAPAPAKHKDKVKPAGTAATAPAGPADPRLHEEPIDGEAGQRTFSPDGRPVAGIDQQYK
jgi:hypothetical protein